MDESRKFTKMPMGQKCTLCGSRRWFTDDGLRYCANGHLIQGFVEIDVAESIDAGHVGQTHRKRREVRVREKRHLTGQAGRALYLEALQLIIRRQVLFLVRQKSHREELETVVRDLWGLRLRGFESVQPKEGIDTEDELDMFSSQTIIKEAQSSDEEKMTLKSHARAKIWNARRRETWPLPKMIDTLAFAYLGCLLLRIPTRIGEVVAWAEGGHLPYKHAYFDLPEEMKIRMPSAYTTALKNPSKKPLAGEKLYDAVLEMAMSYHMNYGMVFPTINDVSFLTQVARRVCLPVQVVVVARRLLQMLDRGLSFPVLKARKFAIDHPEILLLSAIAVSTKFVTPFDNKASPLLELDHETLGYSKFQWMHWHDTVAQPLIRKKELGKKLDYSQSKAEDVTKMSQDEVDAYFAHAASLADDNNGHFLSHFFPSEPTPTPKAPDPEPTEEELENRTKRVLQTAVIMTAETEGWSADAGKPSGPSRYFAYRTFDDLPHLMKGFFEVLGDVGGLQPETLTKGVYMLEQAIVAWQRGHRDEER